MGSQWGGVNALTDGIKGLSATKEECVAPLSSQNKQILILACYKHWWVWAILGFGGNMTILTILFGYYLLSTICLNWAFETFKWLTIEYGCNERMNKEVFDGYRRKGVKWELSHYWIDTEKWVPMKCMSRVQADTIVYWAFHQYYSRCYYILANKMKTIMVQSYKSVNVITTPVFHTRSCTANQFHFNSQRRDTFGNIQYNSILFLVFDISKSFKQFGWVSQCVCAR